VLDEYFPCQPNPALLTCICLPAGPFLPPALVFRRRPHYFPSSHSSFPCCGSHTVPNKLRTTSSRSLLIPLASPSLRRKYSRCTSGYLRRPLFQSAVSAAGAASSTLLPFPVLHHSSANVCTPWALAFQLRLAPGRAIANLSLPSLPFLFLQIVS
jgi:hypothetical protein